MFVEDWDIFFSDFGRDAQLRGEPLRVIFDPDWVDQMGVDGVRPVFRVHEDVAVKSGEYITLIGPPSASYRVVGIQPDTGTKLLILERAP